ncbi:hypothetical protein ACQCVE_04590 [Metabacillus sp. 113a]|uniref:hypothetical protein n=1 Tax=Metabacillus sp. 113a TaxID=3404706 RepID=UPI003CE7C64D
MDYNGYEDFYINARINTDLKSKILLVVFYYAAGLRACKRCQSKVEDSTQMEAMKNVTTFFLKHDKQNLLLKEIADQTRLGPSIWSVY